MHALDPNNPASIVAPSTVLYDGVPAAAPGYCSHVLVNAASMQCGIAYTRMLSAADAHVRRCPPAGALRRRRVGGTVAGADGER